MFPVSVCFGIESERFVEEETERKRLASPGWHSRAELAVSPHATQMVALLERRNVTSIRNRCG
jgi:hypothetical protein